MLPTAFSFHETHHNHLPAFTFFCLKNLTGEQKYLQMWCDFVWVFQVTITLSHEIPTNCSTSWFPWQHAFPSQCDFGLETQFHPVCHLSLQYGGLFWFFTKEKNSLLGRRRRGKAWQSTKQIPSTCLCKLFMLLMHYASGMRHTQIKQHCFMFCLHVSK